jgi:hypothetical protein
VPLLSASKKPGATTSEADDPACIPPKEIDVWKVPSPSEQRLLIACLRSGLPLNTVARTSTGSDGSKRQASVCRRTAGVCICHDMLTSTSITRDWSVV